MNFIFGKVSVSTSRYGRMLATACRSQHRSGRYEQDGGLGGSSRTPDLQMQAANVN